MLLPPFVPPSLRKDIPHSVPPKNPEPTAAESVIVAPEHSDPTADVPPTIIKKSSEGSRDLKGTSIKVEYDASLPSIENFVSRKRYVGTSFTPPKSAFLPPPPREVVEVGGIELIQLQAAPAPSADPALSAEPVDEESESSSASPSESQSKLESSPAAPVDSSTALQMESSPESHWVSFPDGQVESDSEDWLSRERNSFDWEAVATLATSGLSKMDPEEDDEALRAAIEWENTDWDSPPKTGKDQVATVLMRLARRIKNGDLVIDTTKAASIEAALASVLSALLSEQAGKQRNS